MARRFRLKKAVSSASDEALDAAIEWLEGVELFFGALVVAGLLLEVGLATAMFVFLIGTANASVRITFVTGDPECSNFANEIGEVFTLAGWKVGYTSGSFSGVVQRGLVVAQPYFNDMNEILVVGAARRAVEAAELPFTGGSIPAWFMGAGSGEETSEPCAHIYVGPKGAAKATAPMTVAMTPFNIPVL